jgi:inner membrane transporter RhtA
MTPTIKYPHVRATIERYTFKSILPAQPEEIMSSSFEPTNTKNTDVDNTTHGTGEQSRQPGRWQNFAQKVPAQLLALLAIISVQMGAAVGKGLFSAIGPLGTTFLRLGFAAILLLILWRPQIRGLTRTQYLNVLLFGIVLAAMNGAFYSAIHYIPLGIAVTLEFVGPLGLALMQSRRVKDIVWALLAVVGIFLLAPIGQGAVDLLGIGLALLAGICWAGYILCSARIGRSFPGGRGLALAVVVATVAIAPLGIRNGGAALLSPQVLLTGVGIAILSSVIPFSLELEALRRLPSGVFGVLMSIEPAVATLIGFFVLREAIGLREILAIVLIISASVGVSLDATAQPQ